MKQLFVQQDSTFLLVQWFWKKKENWTSIGNKIVNKFTFNKNLFSSIGKKIVNKKIIALFVITHYE